MLGRLHWQKNGIIIMIVMCFIWMISFYETNRKQNIRYIEEWIPKENAYFKKFDIKNISDIVVVQNINAIDEIRL